MRTQRMEAKGKKGMSNIEHELLVQPYDYQLDGIQYGLEHKRLIIGDEPGCGKCQNLDAKLCTPNGFVRMGDAYVGMDIFGQDGNVYKVENIYPQGVKPIYKISFSDGCSTTCSLDHIWCVRDDNRKRRNRGWANKTLQELLDLGLVYNASQKRIESSRSGVLPIS